MEHLLGQTIKMRRQYIDAAALWHEEVTVQVHRVVVLREKPDYALYGLELNRLLYIDGARDITCHFIEPVSSTYRTIFYVVPTTWTVLEDLNL